MSRGRSRAGADSNDVTGLISLVADAYVDLPPDPNSGKAVDFSTGSIRVVEGAIGHAVSLMAHRRVCLPSDRESEQSNRCLEEGEGIGLRYRRNSGGNCVRTGKSSPDEGAYLPAVLGRYNQLGAGGLAEV